MVFATSARTQGSSATIDAYARMIARSDAIVVGRVLEAGQREVPDTAHPNVVQMLGYARIAVDQWVTEADTDRTIEVRPGAHLPLSDMTQRESGAVESRVILYLMRSAGAWWILREPTLMERRSEIGVQILPVREIPGRILAIQAQAKATSPETLAAQADLIVMGSLEKFTVDPGGVECRVERVIAGSVADSLLTVVFDSPSDLALGRAILLLKARPDSRWGLLGGDASCYYLDRDRVAHSKSSLDKVIGQLAVARASRSPRK